MRKTRQKSKVRFSLYLYVVYLLVALYVRRVAFKLA